MAVPVFSSIVEKKKLTQSIAQVRQLVVDCKVYAADHGKRFPDNLDQLLQAKLLDAPTLALLKRDPLGSAGHEEYFYLGQGHTDSDDGKIIVISSENVRHGKHVVGHLDGSVELVTSGAPVSP
jgi:hypothetical protein